MSLSPTIGWSCPWPAWRPPVDVPLAYDTDSPCGYFPGRLSIIRGFYASDVAPEIYHRFMDAGFRHSGMLFYQPVCRGCRDCLPLRVPVGRFHPSKSQRRCRRRNADLRVLVGTPLPTDEKFTLYTRYLHARHTGPMNNDDRQAFETFLYASPVRSIECAYRNQAGRLLAVGICDVSPQSLSTVYFYFDPDEGPRSLGTFGALWEIDFAARCHIPWYYMGYWVRGCRTMEYKRSFRPCQILGPDGVWRDGAEPCAPGPDSGPGMPS